jgi:hypothetical protein
MQETQKDEPAGLPSNSGGAAAGKNVGMARTEGIWGDYASAKYELLPSEITGLPLDAQM